MHWDAIGAIGEVFGALAVVASVGYLAVQIRKQTDQSRLSATRELATQFQAGLDMLALDGELCSIWYRGMGDYQALTKEDRVRLSMFFQRMTRVIEAQYIHSLTEQADATYFESVQLAYFEFLTYPGAQQWWEVSKGMFGAEFQSYLDRIIVQAKVNGRKRPLESGVESAI